MEIQIPYNWSPRAYQIDSWRALQNGCRRAVEVWHRRAGKDLFAINWCASSLVERVGLYWHMLPTYRQGRKIVWNGFTKEGRRFLDHFPQELIEAKNDTEMRITFKNGSIYEVVGTDNPDNLVGTNPVGVVFSEYSLHDPKAWDLIRPILAENEGWALFIYTPRGHNHGHLLFKMAQKNPKWHCSVLKAGSGPGATKREDGTPVVSDAAIQDELDSGMSEAMVNQEFYVSFDSPVVGSYYGAEMLRMDKEGRIRDVSWDPRLPVHTGWDLGMDDATSITFFQELPTEVRIIDYYEATGEGLTHYAKELDKRPYKYGTHYGPHDLAVRELGTGKSRIEVARSLGIRFRLVRRLEIEDGIQAVRDLLPLCYIDQTKCKRLVDALMQYQKEFDPDRKVFSSRPLHNWTSHPCDSMRTVAVGRRVFSAGKKERQTTADNEYSILN